MNTRDLTDTEIDIIFHEWFNFSLLFSRRFYIVRDVSNRVYVVKIFEDFNSSKVLVTETYRSLTSLAKGLNELCLKFCC